MMIEQTLMKISKSPDGLKDVTLRPEVVKNWALSLSTFGVVDREIDEFFENEGSKLEPKSTKKKSNSQLSGTKWVGSR